ncbi:hypothetical protein AYI69_g3836 [Smittium culicis]|uniref:Uncharacterized protein n=1 Tax=Smittium culicis TaxID=133412 RepID=A0A1R1YIP6_9FUNG|nr:hypothetical protein AYI69_g3836 [Smittium culicis]
MFKGFKISTFLHIKENSDTEIPEKAKLNTTTNKRRGLTLKRFKGSDSKSLISRSAIILEKFGRAFNISSKEKDSIKLDELHGGIKSYSISGAIGRNILQPRIGATKILNTNEIHRSNASITLSSLEETENKERSYDFSNSSTFEIDVKSFPRSTSRRFQLADTANHREIFSSAEAEREIQKSNLNVESNKFGIQESNENSEDGITQNQNTKTEFPLTKEGIIDAVIDEADFSASILNDNEFEAGLLNRMSSVLTAEGIDRMPRPKVNESQLQEILSEIAGEDSQSELAELEYGGRDVDTEANGQQEQIYSIEEALHVTEDENSRSIQEIEEDEDIIVDEHMSIRRTVQRNRNFRVIESDYVNSSGFPSDEELAVETRESDPSRGFYHNTSQHNRIINPEHILYQDFSGYDEATGFGGHINNNRDRENNLPAISRVALASTLGDNYDTSILTPEYIISHFDRILRPSQHSELRQSRDGLLARLYNSTFEQSTSAFPVPVIYASLNSDISRRT